MRHTAGSGARGLRRYAGLAVLALLSLYGEHVQSEPAPIGATVVWVRNERAYIALADSAALQPGDLVTFVERDRPIAWGSITDVVGSEMSVAQLTSGSLARVKKLDRLKILSERPLLRAPPLVRIGFPAAQRGQLLASCEAIALQAPQPPGSFRTDTLSTHSFRLVREMRETSSPWPDTLIVRLFEESADEEIALERGEIDIAVFQPGELSSYIRAAPRWQGFSFAVQKRGVLSAAWFGPAAADTGRTQAIGDDPRMAMLRLDPFRGDLVAWEAGPEHDASSYRALPDPARFEVDRSIPGWGIMERQLNRGRAPGRDRVPTVRVFHLDAAIADSSELVSGVADYVATHRLASHLGASMGDGLRVAYLFAIRRPVLCAPAFRPYLSGLGPDAIVDLVSCVSGRR